MNSIIEIKKTNRKIEEGSNVLESKNVVELEKTIEYKEKEMNVDSSFSKITINKTPEVEGLYVVYFTTDKYTGILEQKVEIMNWDGDCFTWHILDEWGEPDYEHFSLDQTDGFIKIPELGWNKKSIKQAVVEFMRDNIDTSDEEFEKEFNKEFLDKKYLQKN